MSGVFERAFASIKGMLSVSALLNLVLVFAAYFLTAKGGLALAAVSGFAALVWPPTGIALVALLIFGPRFWPAIALAAFLANLTTGAAPFVALGIATGNTLEAVTGVFLLQRYGFDPDLKTIRDGLLFKLFGAFGSTLISATIGVMSLWLGNVVDIGDISSTWLAWWVGDMLGALIVGYLLLNIRKLFLKKEDVYPSALEILSFTIVLIFFSAIIFLNLFNLGQGQSMAVLVYLTFPLLLWAALRLGTTGSAFAIATVSIISVLGTAFDKGPFVGGALSHNLLYLQIFMGSVSVTTMVLATAVAERFSRAVRTHETDHRQTRIESQFGDGNKKNYLSRKSAQQSVVGRLSRLLFGFILIAGILLTLNYFGMQTLSAIRAYVGGEGLYSKAQKDAVYQLRVYAFSRDESDFAKYEQLIRVPLGDQKARLELEKPNADLNAADAYFIEGKNDPADARNLSLLFLRFRHVSYMEKAIAIWEEGDAQIAELVRLADTLHSQITTTTTPEEDITQTLLTIDRLNASITVLEDNFSSTLGEAARWITQVLILAMLGVAALLLIPGLAISLFIIRNIGKLDHAKTEFISLTSHQLRTPPTGIKWYTGMLLDGDLGEVTAPQKKYLEQIAYNNQRMIDIVDSVLDISQIELGVFHNNPVATDVCLLIEKLLADLEFPLTDKEIMLSRRFECGPQPIFVDPTLMRIIIQNLLVNAVKYTPRGGEISFVADVHGTKLTLTIADTGCGIPKKDVQNIFKKFYRASNSQEFGRSGTGLGLYITRSILNQIGGDISFTSEVGKGTTFFVTIPIKSKNSKNT